MAFVRLSHQFENFPCMAVEASLHLFWAYFLVFHTAYMGIFLCARGSSLDSLRGAVSSSEHKQPGILHVCLFPYLSRARPGTSIKRCRGRSDWHYLIVLSQFYQIRKTKCSCPPQLLEEAISLLLNMILKQIACVKFALLHVAQRRFFAFAWFFGGRKICLCSGFSTLH